MMDRTIRVVGIAALTAFAVVAFTPLVERVAARLRVPQREEAASAIVVLGAGAADGMLSEASLRRAIHGVELYRRGLAPVLLFSGGHHETVLRERLATELGVPPAAIVTERGPRTTREEAQAVARRFEREGRRRVLLVTDAPVLRRASAVFARAGFEVLPAAPPAQTSPLGAPERRLELARQVLMELCGLVYYAAAGYL